jgi:hypothetical protein
MGKLDTKLQQNSVEPFLDFCNILNLSLFRSNSGQHYTGSLLIESLDHFNRMVFSQVVQTDRRNSCPGNVVAVLVSCDGLKDAALK